MNESAPRFIGDRITIEKSKEQMVVTIRQQIARWQEALLIAWIVAWTFCGAFFIYYFIMAGDNIGQRIFFGCFMAAWFYFEWRITKAFMWRKKGREILTFKAGKLFIKNAIGNSGKTEEFACYNIFKLGLIPKDSTSFLSFLDDSFWVIGGDRVGFSYSGTKIQLGKHLELKEAERLIRVIESAMKEYK
jgi:hypothetical protein